MRLVRNSLVAVLITVVLSSDSDQVVAADTPAAERTRTVLLKARVTVNYKNTPLREVLKEIAAQVEMLAEKPILWTYAPEAMNGNQPVTYSCESKRVEDVLDDLGKLTGTGYIIASKDDHKHDGWIRITKGPERGTGKYPDDGMAAAPIIDDPDEAKAAARLKAAKELIETGKEVDAKAVLKLVTDKYPKTKAAAEAKMLLEKFSK